MRHCLPFILALSLLSFPAVAEPSASEPTDAAASAAEVGQLDAQFVPELRQTLLYVRLAEPLAAPLVIDVLDPDGHVVVTLPLAVERGAGLVVWDGKQDDGESVPSGLYTARLQRGDVALTAEIVR